MGPTRQLSSICMSKPHHQIPAARDLQWGRRQGFRYPLSYFTIGGNINWSIWRSVNVKSLFTYWKGWGNIYCPPVLGFGGLFVECINTRELMKGWGLGEEGSQMLLGCSWGNTLECCCLLPCIMPSVGLWMLYLLYREGRRRGGHFYCSNPIFSSCLWHSNKTRGKIM